MAVGGSGGEVRLGPAVERVLLAVEPAGALDDAELELSVEPGAWLPVLGRRPAAQTTKHRVDVDQLVLAGPVDRVRARGRGLASVWLGAAGPPPALGRADALGEIRLGVPFLTQRSLPPAAAGRACCPTALAMALGFHGVHRPLAEAAEAVWDPRHGLYGSWLRAAAVATAAGRPAVVRQARSWDAVAGWLRELGPVIASVAYGEGGLPGAVMPRTDGHLVVVTGLDGRGGVLVHDPAGPAGAGLTLDGRALGRAWASHGAVAVVVGPRTGQEPRPRGRGASGCVAHPGAS